MGKRLSFRASSRSLSLWAFAAILLAGKYRHVHSFLVSETHHNVGKTQQPSPNIASTALFSERIRKNLSAAERERREEERRRQERRDDVVIGKTSAIGGAKDYAIDPSATEQEWMRYASRVEQEIFRETDRGMESLKMLQCEEADRAFKRVFELKPNAYLWQAGIAKFYLGEIESAAAIFSRSAAIYESRFGEPASEERIWRNACELKLKSTLAAAASTRKSSSSSASPDIWTEAVLDLEPLPQRDNIDKFLHSETRKVIRIAQELFQAAAMNDELKVIIGRARLQSIGGNLDYNPVADRKMWKLNSWYYLGLHYDAMGDAAESKKCMKMALRLCPSSGNGSDIIHTLPMLHMSQRDWFDDDELEVISTDDPAVTQIKKTSILPNEPDPIFVDLVRSGLCSMKHSDLKDALKARGQRVVGSKEELVERLLANLVADTGLLA